MDSGKLVVVVEDDAEVRELLRQAVGEIAGMHAVLVSSVEEALVAISIEQPRVVLVDTEVPGAPGFLAGLKDDVGTSRIPVIALVSRGLETVRSARGLGFDDAVSAGELDALNKIVNRYLRNSTNEGQ